ncbi:hypothetical protein RRG08_035877 [Elysia crispata]|uniref:2-aminoethanethiol dioxygenase n=1 Tax=Elysia crispata TaxID=231223 RepID=A0AAE1A1U0_9GAST|nr:hypothetical protein RRG08_035877 [Elysia crispata]
MATPIQRLAQLSYKIFAGQPKPNELVTKETLYPIIQTLNEIKAEDLNFDPNEVVLRDKALKKHGDVAPVTCMNVHQNCHFTLAVFIVKSGGSLPLHDHPHMFGLLKVISGSVKITSYTKVDSQPLPSGVEFSRTPPPHIVTVKRNQDVILADSDNCCILSPSEGNFHEIKPLTDVAAFLDVLAPPYNNTDRDCSYYKELPVQCHIQKDIQWLAEVSQPRSYWCDVIQYKGPPLNSNDYSSEDSS